MEVLEGEVLAMVGTSHRDTELEDSPAVRPPQVVPRGVRSHMEDDPAVGRIPVMAVSGPVGPAGIDLDIPAQGPTPHLDDDILEVRPSRRRPFADVADADGPAFRLRCRAACAELTQKRLEHPSLLHGSPPDHGETAPASGRCGKTFTRT